IWGSIRSHGLLSDVVIVSDGAGQFNIGEHALCWVHAERLVHKLYTATDQQRDIQQRIRSVIWKYYTALKTYQNTPSPERRETLRRRFDRIFQRRTGFVTLDRLLRRIHAQKQDFLRVLERPDIPLHTNGSENDIRSVVTKRKISGGTRSDSGRTCRDTFLGLLKTCNKLGISFWDYLGARVKAAKAVHVPPLPQLVAQRCASA
ncbi:MAG: IS66 family transposase, partial [Roseovarius sp.]